MQEIESLAQNSNQHKIAQKFMSRMVAGSILAVLIGKLLDEQLGSGPWIMLGLLMYVIFGSLYLLVIEAQKNGK